MCASCLLPMATTRLWQKKQETIKTRGPRGRNSLTWVKLPLQMACNIFSNTLMTRQWLKQFLKYLAYKVKMLKFSNVTRKKSHPQCLLSTFESTGISVQQKKRKIDFQDDSHLGFPIGMIIAIFDLQVTLMLPTKFRVNWLLGLEEVKNRFSRWLSWRPSWISDWHDFSYFWSTSHPDAS